MRDSKLKKFWILIIVFGSISLLSLLFYILFFAVFKVSGTFSVLIIPFILVLCFGVFLLTIIVIQLFLSFKTNSRRLFVLKIFSEIFLVIPLGLIVIEIPGWSVGPNLSSNTIPTDAYDFDSSQPYDINHDINIDIDNKDDFKVMFITDLHFDINELFFKNCISQNFVLNNINNCNPDVIFVLGDTVSSHVSQSLPYFIKMMNSTKIPWVPLYGNHEGDYGLGTKQWVANEYDSLCPWFKFGPKDFNGCGNYVVNIKNNNELIHSYIVLDTVHANDFTVTDKQKEFSKYVLDNITHVDGYQYAQDYKVSILTHVPLPEYNYFGDVGTTTIYGEKREDQCISGQNGYFDLLKSYSPLVDQVICGHDHVNDFSFIYDGIQLTYALKSDFNSYYNRDMVGYTEYVIEKNGDILNQQNVFR